jgi:hypothetical protein
MTKQEEARINQDFNWLVKNMIRFQPKHAGKWVAVVNKKIAGIGKTAVEAYKKAKITSPQNEPLLDVVPTKECLVL